MDSEFFVMQDGVQRTMWGMLAYVDPRFPRILAEAEELSRRAREEAGAEPLKSGKERKAMNREERVEMVRNFLAEEGFRPTLDKDGDIVFKVEGHRFFVELDAKDEQYFRVARESFWDLDSDEVRARAAVAANETMRRLKAVKVLLGTKVVYAVIELFCEPPSSFIDVLPRTIDSLQSAVTRFCEKMNEEKTP
jgi:hypothetical protein